MKKCQSCNTALLPSALFCHNCGKQTDGDGVVCFACHNVNPSSARFCYRCGTAINIQYTPNPNISPIYELDFNDIPTLPTQLTEAFKVSISLAIEQEHNAEKEALFLQTFDKSPFRRQYLEEATVHMTQEFEEVFEERGISAFKVIEHEIERQFSILLERFFVEFCNPLLPFPISNTIFRYNNIFQQSNSLSQMINDYLDLEEENVVFYANAIEMPFKKLKNARSTFFHPQTGETPCLFIDQSLLRSGKEGTILTARSIYWKAYFQKSAQIHYNQINKLRFYADRLEINGIYLNISPSINYKLYRLLHRLRTL